MSPQGRPEAVSLDPGSDEVPPTLVPILTDPDTSILLIVAAEADETAARLAIRLAEARAAEGASTVLADASFNPPRLHEMLDVPNLEGLADLFLFGASIGHVASRPEGRSFDFIPAGAYVPDQQAVLRSGRWERVRTEFAASRSMLMLLVPAASAGIGELSRRVGRAVVIATERQADRALGRLAPTCDVLAVIAPKAPAAPPAAATAAAAAATSSTPAPAGEARPTDDPPDPHAPEDVAAPAEAPPRAAPSEAITGTEADLSEPPVIRRSAARRSVSPLIAAALALALAAAAWLAYQEYLAPAEAAPAAAVLGPEVPTERGEPVETPVPISVAVEAHSDLASARERVTMLRAAEPQVGFYLAPVVSNGDLYYRILAGPVRDREAGMALMERLVASGQKSAADAWAVRPTELAFHLGEFDTRDAASARVDSLATSDIPSYIVPIRYDPGEPRYRVYGGAYENQAEADVMREMLQNAGIEPRLVARTGEPVR